MHKAYDECRDLVAALEVAVDLGFASVLTSGGARSAEEGAGTLAALVGRAAGRIEVLAGGGIRPHNAAALVAATGVTAVHLRAPAERDGREVTDPALVARARQALDGAVSSAPC